jgi:hypothetical protein
VRHYCPLHMFRPLSFSHVNDYSDVIQSAKRGLYLQGPDLRKTPDTSSINGPNPWLARKHRGES